MFLSWSDFATAPIVKLKGRAAYVWYLLWRIACTMF
jgi:hypothetical protein